MDDVAFQRKMSYFCRNEMDREVNGYRCTMIHICSVLEELMESDLELRKAIEEAGEECPLTEEEEELYSSLYEQNVLLLRSN